MRQGGNYKKMMIEVERRPGDGRVEVEGWKGSAGEACTCKYEGVVCCNKFQPMRDGKLPLGLLTFLKFMVYAIDHKSLCSCPPSVGDA